MGEIFMLIINYNIIVFKNGFKGGGGGGGGGGGLVTLIFL